MCIQLERGAGVSAAAFSVACVMLLCGGCGGPRGGGNYFTIKGSDTMAHLVSDWVEVYLQDHPDVYISVTGGGSGTGIAALMNQSTELCMASRDLKEEEIEMAKQRGFDLHEFTVAIDGLAIFVHPSNPVRELSIEQLRQIYSGAYTNWREVGGLDLPIRALSRESNSGTYVYFQEHVLGRQDFAPGVLLIPATSGIVQSVASDAGAIGYGGIAYALEGGSRVQILAIRDGENAEAVFPSAESIKLGVYSIARPLYLITASAPEPPVQAFIDFCLSPAGQEIVERAGYVPIN